VKNWKLFVIPFVLTILVYRFFLLFSSPLSFQYHDKFHHAYIGILILVVIGLIYHIKKRVNLVFFGIGMGSLIDEIFYFFSRGTQYDKYWNNLSTYGTATLMIVIITVYFMFNYPKRKRIKSSP
jgi:hypothetical protein